MAIRIDSCRDEKDCLCGRNFSFCPRGAVSEKFLFPDRHSTLKGIDAEAAGVEGGGAMRRADHDEYRGLADFEPSKTMNHGETPDRKFFAHLLADFAHFSEGHGLVRLVFQIQSCPVTRVVANNSFKHDDSAIGRCLQLLKNLRGIDPVSDQRALILSDGSSGRSAASTHGRKKCDLVSRS